MGEQWVTVVVTEDGVEVQQKLPRKEMRDARPSRTEIVLTTGEAVS